MYIYLGGYYFVCSLAGGCYRLSAFASNNTFILIPRYEYPAERPLVLSLYCWHHILTPIERTTKNNFVRYLSMR